MNGWTADDWFATIRSMAALPVNSESSLRSFALEVVHRLRDAGFEAVWAGGCVRDALLGVAPADYDVATSALPDDVIRLLVRWRLIGGSSDGGRQMGRLMAPQMICSQ